MRVVVIGLGVQGHKRRDIAGSDVVAVVDPINQDADVRRLEDVDPASYEAVIMCTPDDVKTELLTFVLGLGKHVLVEKPILAVDDRAIEVLAERARANRALLYTAYNHRFEPHFVRMRDLIASGVLGKIYCVRMFYGNGTARLVRDSAWRDRNAGVLPDLGSHLLDTLLFWFGNLPPEFELWSANRFENRAFDHISFGAEATPTTPLMQLEMTLLSWRNHFYADVFAENGSAHISSLCKWGPATFIHRTRVLPSGRPGEVVDTIEQADPTWALEYAHFKGLATSDNPAGASNTGNDVIINRLLNSIAKRALRNASGARA
jgi:predicted dehydrogenase